MSMKSMKSVKEFVGRNKKGLAIVGVLSLGSIFFMNAKGVHDVPYANSDMPYTNFSGGIKADEYKKVTVYGQTIKGEMRKDEKPFATVGPEEGIDQSLIDKMEENNVELRFKEASESLVMPILFGALVIVAILSLREMKKQTSAKKESKAKPIDPDKNKTRFKDLAGIDEAKEEVKEMVDFLKNPGKYTKLGGQVPRGALMVGPPGTGKTLLARAIAGEAKVPFFTISGSDFVEQFVGIGASRVRDMFDDAKKHAPCIVFIDEIDAVGKARNDGMNGNDEREQTLNQLLVEMDGFEGNTGVIVLAATNRADTLDKALLRPGRFDKQVDVGLPDIRGREQILNVHIKKVPQADDIELKYIAQGTPGFSGADLANLINLAALDAAKNNADLVSMADLEKAKDKVLMGAEKTSMIMDEEEKRNTANHEAGHAIVGRRTKGHDPVYKVSIMPRGRALGITMFLPEKDSFSKSKTEIEGMVDSLFGGRIAEVMTLEEGGVTTGASNDIERATELVMQMMGEWGLSEEVGPINIVSQSQFGGSNLKSVILGNKGLNEIFKSIIDASYKRAEQILKDNKDILHEMSDALMMYETIDKDQIDALMDGMKAVDIPKPRSYGEVVAANNDNDVNGGSDMTQKMAESANSMKALPFLKNKM